MRKTLLSLIAITAIASATVNDHAMKIIGPNEAQVPVGTVDTHVNGSDLFIAQEGVSGHHDHVYTVDMSSLKTSQGTQNGNNIHSNLVRINNNHNSINRNSANITHNTNNITANTHWADQIQGGIVSGSDLAVIEKSRTGGITKTTHINMSGLVTDQGTQNSTDIATNANGIATNAAGVITNAAGVTQNAGDITNLDTRVTSNEGNIVQNAQGVATNAAGVTQNAGDISNLDSRVTTNEGDIAQNAQGISHNAGDIASNRSSITGNKREIAKNTTRPDQIIGGSVNGSVLSITEQARAGVPPVGGIRPLDSNGVEIPRPIIPPATKTTKIDLAELTTNQGNQNASDIATNGATITHNAGGVVNGTTIKSNKDLTTENTAQWQSISFNEQAIQYNTDWNGQQQGQIDDLYGKTDNLQDQIFGISGDIDGLSEYMGDSSAGAMAVATIDFGTVHKDELEIGAGLGMSGGDAISTSFAGGVGLKYGITDETAAVAKGWVSQHGNYGAGAGVVYKY